MRFLEKLPQSKEIAIQLKSFFDKETIEQLARSSKFVQRISPLTGSKFTNLCISGLSEQGMAISLNQLCCLAVDMEVQIGEQSLNERFNEKAVSFMKALFEKAITQRLGESSINILSYFSQIMIEDSTVIQLPENLKDLFRGSGGGASKSSVKVDCTYDFKSSNISLKIKEGCQPDSTMNLPSKIVAKSLWLRDLGYFKMTDFEKIATEKAYYISRLKYNVNIYLTDDKKEAPVDILSLLKGMRKNQVKDMQVFIGAKKRLPTRLVLQKVPKSIADKKRYKLKTDKQKKAKKTSKGRLEFCDCNAYITNLEKQECKPHLIMVLYKIRWQIEILFKVWKSILQVEQPRRISAERLQCLLYGQLIWAVLNMKIFQAFKAHFWNEHKMEISELKVYKIMKTFHHQLIHAINHNCEILYEKWVNKICNIIDRLGRKQYKKGNPNPAFTGIFP